MWSWSAPAAIVTGGMGFGGQVGAELTDFVMVLNTTAAVETFMHHGSITLGGNISVAAGPIGRNVEASGTASVNNVAAVYSYSRTRGLFAGVSVEGSVIFERFDANAKMYGRKVTTRELLTGFVPTPPQADPLYQALQRRLRWGSAPSPSQYDYYGRRGEFDSNQIDGSDMMHRAAVVGDYSRDYGDASDGFHGPIKVRAKYNFNGPEEGDLPFHKGDIITVTKRTDSQNAWWTGTLNSRTGIFPANFVELL
ncbi:hypothetical protein BX666DRAFT_53973 [Dichotomocladium elegans]|nr:hypothetical protein BX666DRAFT_53973 [Dichotomocladium elegans]